MKTINSNTLAICRLFTQYPLYKSRKACENGYELKVLLIGEGEMFDTILKEVFTMGQLLDTALYVAVLTKDAKLLSDKLKTSAPTLGKFINIYADDKKTSHPEHEMKGGLYLTSCSLGPELESDAIAKYTKDGYSYVIISLGDDKANAKVARSCTRLTEDGAVVSYQSSRKPALEFLKNKKQYAFGYQAEPSLEHMETIGYNLHYAYSKGANDRASRAQISAEFDNEDYYTSNVSGAMHIRSKLACLGIDSGNLAKDAQEFSERMLKEPQVVDRLAALEHRRWLFEKIFKGIVQMKNVNMIYSNGVNNTHGKDWHCCMLPSREVSALDKLDWDADIKRYKNSLDPLDYVTLQIHQKCKEIAAGRKESITKQLKGVIDTIALNYNDSDEIYKTAHRLQLAINQMWQRKKSVIGLYENSMHKLIHLLESESTESATSSSDDNMYKNLMDALSTLKANLAPLVEYVSYKDYKEQDYIMIRQIPFALTHPRKFNMGKLMSMDDTANLLSILRMEPVDAVMIGLVDEYTNTAVLGQKLEHAVNYLKNNQTESNPAICLITDMKNRVRCEKALENLKQVDTKILEVSKLTANLVNEAVKKLAADNHLSYIDVTDGDPILESACSLSGLPLIANKKGSLVNVCDAEEVTYPAPRKAIRVQDMFEISGTVKAQESHSSILSDFTDSYKVLWELAKNPKWNRILSPAVAKAYKKQKPEYDLTSLKNSKSFIPYSMQVGSSLAVALKPVLEQMKQREFIQEYSISKGTNGIHRISLSLPGKEENNPLIKALEEIKAAHKDYYSYSFAMDSKVKSSESKGTSANGKNDKNYIKKTLLSVDTYTIKGMPLPSEFNIDDRNALEKVFDTLKAHKLILDYEKTANSYSFRFANPDVLSAFQTNGNLFECYLYYSLLLGGHYDDVEMGWKFKHSAEEKSAMNEIDVICTKGAASYFISAKTADLTNRNDFRYIIYEISQMAMTFGMNASAILAANNTYMFDKDSKEINLLVTQAQARGVYVLGKECFEGDKLLEVMERIAAGRDDWYECVKPGSAK